jgi:hypothetical protein
MPTSNATDFDIVCLCSAVYHTSDEHIGSYVKCVCGRRVPVQRTNAAALKRSPTLDSAGRPPSAASRIPAPVDDALSAKLKSISRLIKGKAALQRVPLPWKVLSALVLCCVVAVAFFWAHRPSGSRTIAMDTAQSSPQVTWDDEQVKSAATSVRGVPPAERSLPTYSTADVEIIPAGGVSGAGQVRPETGMNIIHVPGQRGRGTLRINNGIGQDATVKLVNVSTGKPVRWVYIRSSDETTVRGVAPGSCRVRFAIGKNWDKRLRKFRDDRSYSEFDDSLDFQETKTADKVHYSLSR